MIFVIAIISSFTLCSLVFDKENQKGIYLSDYCPKMKYCPEGSHVMCMYYDPKVVMGSKCLDARNVTVSTSLANKLLDVTNGLRSKIAQGLEKGKNGERLPRGYGIFRLKWDNELATFAQVLANQCVLRHDFCRATKKFPDPGQTAGIVRYHGPTWMPASKSGNWSKTGLDEEKLFYAITQTLRTWYGQKSNVDVKMVTNYPNWQKDYTNQNGKLYLTMIYGSATHMGCGISAYSDYVFYDAHASIFYNTVLVICNYSAQPRPGAAVYNTVPPTDTESSFNACGCPIGTLEDDDCLCLEVPREPEPPKKTQKCGPGGCDPTVVLLPIFTMEDAPPEKHAILRFTNDSSILGMHDVENTIDSFEEIIDNNVSGVKGGMRKSRKTLELQTHINLNGKKQRIAHGQAVTIKSRHFDKPNDVIELKESNHHENMKPTKQLQGHTQRQSVFTKTPIFELPGSNFFLSTNKKNVLPRKDFSTGKQLVHKYLYNKNGLNLNNKHIFDGTSENNNLNEFKSAETVRNTKEIHSFSQPKRKTNADQQDVHFHDILNTKKNITSAKNNILNHKESHEIAQSNEIDKMPTSVAQENDKKFMALLDTLEEEVKHVELRDKEKQIFDAKIKKIYGKIVGKPSSMITRKNFEDRLKNYKIHDIEKKPDDEDTVRNLPPSFDVKDDSNFFEESNNQLKYSDADIDDKYSKIDITDTDTIDRPSNKKLKQLLNYDGRLSRRSRNFKPNSRNYLNSYEYMQRKYDNELKDRKTYKDMFGNDIEKLRHRANSLDYKKNNKYYNNEPYEELLSVERRKYYQEKLDSIERKLQESRHFNRRKDVGQSPHLRAVKRTDNQINPLYTGRARILHGY